MFVTYGKRRYQVAVVDSTATSTDAVIYIMADPQSVFSILVTELWLYDEYTSGVRFHPDGVGEVSFNPLPEVTVITMSPLRFSTAETTFYGLPMNLNGRL